jgi:hypothetical protein
LYVKSRGTPKPGVSDRVVTSPDLYHLMLAEVGLAGPPAAAQVPIVAEWYQTDAATAAALTERGETTVPLDRDLLAWVDAGTKWIVNSRGHVEAYDLDDDPGELSPLPLSPDDVTQARARARAWWEANPPLPATMRSAAELDPAVIDRLRNLGYVH